MTESIRAAVVDDERHARQLVCEYLEETDDVEVVAVCANGFEAVKAIAEHRPDLLFLDIQMPKLDGFEVLELLGPDDEPVVVFTTAHDEFALRAFEVAAADYLLKPFSKERFDAMLDTVRNRLQLRGGRRSPELERLADAARPRPRRRILVRDGARVEVVPTPRLLYLEARGDYVRIVHRDGEAEKKTTLGTLAEQLDPERFLRLHRSYVVNLDAIDRVEPYAKNSRVALLDDGSRVPVSRTGYARLRELL